jgi:hypothetical protein
MCAVNHLILMCYAHGMENLAIFQHWDTLHYAIIHGGGYCPKFEGLSEEIMFTCSRQHRLLWM